MAGKRGEAAPNASRCVRHENVEIERKFTVSGDTESKIIEAGGTCISDGSFTDCYFDTDIFSLTLADHWLRCRQGKWELKVPLSDINKDKTSDTCTKYSEIADENGIMAHLLTIFTKSDNTHSHSTLVAERETLSAESNRSLEKWLSKHKIKPFAEFTTHRKSYSMYGGILVALDETDFGFSVGEIEVMTGRSEEDISGAVAKIDQTAEKLGLGTQPVAAGKMSAFLRKFAPEHYETLLAAGVLQR